MGFGFRGLGSSFRFQGLGLRDCPEIPIPLNYGIYPKIIGDFLN